MSETQVAAGQPASPARAKPCFVELKAGVRYAWCACGRSSKQPFCDGSHRGTGIEPLVFTADADREAVLCGCKRSRNAPWCDGTHNSLTERYAEADAREIEASAKIAPAPRSDGAHGTAWLDGGCYVRTVDPGTLRRDGTLRWASVIGASDGARFLSQYYVLADPGESGVLRFEGSDTLLFNVDGDLRMSLAGREFRSGPESGVFVRAGEAFRLHNHGDGVAKLLLSVCPQGPGPQWLASLPREFDAAIPERVFGVDEALREPMADRFYQVLNGPDNGSLEVTQFIGEIPRSRAAAHRHLYEEALLILHGEGFMWTENARAVVQPGDIVFLPRKQLHSLECTSAGGMRLMGAFYPAGSPAINY